MGYETIIVIFLVIIAFILGYGIGAKLSTDTGCPIYKAAFDECYEQLIENIESMGTYDQNIIIEEIPNILEVDENG